MTVAPAAPAVLRLAETGCRGQRRCRARDGAEVEGCSQLRWQASATASKANENTGSHTRNVPRDAAAAAATSWSTETMKVFLLAQVVYSNADLKTTDTPKGAASVE